MSTSRHDPRVSVVMIFRDPPLPFFDEAIESVLAQTQPGVELLLCDDGSRPAATGRATEWAGREPSRIRYLEHERHAHRGMSSTRNLGLAAAGAEVVAFLDADDVWLPGHLEHELGLLTAHPEADFVCGRALDWYSWEDPDHLDVLAPLAWPGSTVVPAPGMLAAVLRRGHFSTPTCSLLVRRSALIEVGGSVDRFTSMFEDQILLAKLYLTRSCVMSDADSAWYRRHDQSSSAQAERAGLYHPDAPNPSHRAYLEWLVAQPELARPEAVWAQLRERIVSALTDYENRPSLSRTDRVKAFVPQPLRRVLGRARRVGHRIDGRRSPFGTLRRTSPVSRQFGYDRGQPIDRYYVEQFLAEHAHLIRGHVLEVGDDEYTRMFGGDRVERSDVLNINPGDPATTIVADLADAPQIESEQFDCLLITQTLHLLYDLPAAVATLRRILKPGGTLLATVPGISQLSDDVWADTWYWAITPLAARRLVAEEFGAGRVEVVARGNVLSSIAFLEGLASRELTVGELAVRDPQFPMLVSIRADR